MCVHVQCSNQQLIKIAEAYCVQSLFSALYFCFSPNKADFIRAKYQFLAYVNKHKDTDITSVDDLSQVLTIILQVAP